MTDGLVVILYEPGDFDVIVQEISYGVEEEGGYFLKERNHGLIQDWFALGEVVVKVHEKGCFLFVKEGGEEGYLLSKIDFHDGEMNADYRLLGKNAVRFMKGKRLKP